MALWQGPLRRTLEAAGFKVGLTNYGEFDLLRFLWPFAFFRRKVVDHITKQIRAIVRLEGPATCSVVAHSFGTYVLAEIMRRHADLRFSRIIFCGSVVPYDFPFADYAHRFDQPLVSEVGTRDIWPALAQMVTWGYGSAGSFGFRGPGVRDRWHNGKAHSDFLNAEFCKRYWVPYLRDGTVVDDDPDPEPPPAWLALIRRIQPRYVLLVLILAAALLLGRAWWPGPAQ